MTESKAAEEEQLPVETVDRIILHQEKELLIKEKEIDLGFQQDKHQFEYAKESLAYSRTIGRCFRKSAI